MSNQDSTQTSQQQATRSPLRIAISGKSGCGNSTVSRLVAEALKIRLVNYTFHDIAREEGVTFDALCERAERDSYWDHYLDRKQVEMATAQSSVLGSRLAIWKLTEADIRVYLTAPVHERARRIRQREGGTFEQVLAETEARDRRDRARYLRTYDIDIDRYEFADMVIDTTVAHPAGIRDMILDEVAGRFPLWRSAVDAGRADDSEGNSHQTG